MSVAKVLEGSAESQVFNNLISQIQDYSSTIDIEKIKKAYECSKAAHKNQKRKSGEPYIIHPLHVAAILADFHMDEASLITALLHDVVEDTDISLIDISKEFGSNIAFLVDGVTKISKIQFRNLQDKQSENIRKMIVAMCRDVRVILVKLADRLHNLRTLEYMPPEKQFRIANESLDIYTPLAARLGMHAMKTEMEDLAFRYISPETFKSLQSKMSQLNKNRDSYTNQVLEVLNKAVKKTKIKNLEVQGRAKNIYSIHRKMSKYDLAFDDIHDLTAFRVCVDKVHECYEVLGLIHSLWSPVQGRFKDYIAMPKINGYQSLHTTVIGPEGYRMEIQIRSHKMHLIAERGIASHWIYKEATDTKEVSSEKAIGRFNWLKDLVSHHQTSNDSSEFLENVKLDLFESEIYVFTPKGDIKEFPKKATPIDFAYSIHTDIGSRVVGAKVNNIQVPLKHQLKNGDMVEVITSNKQKPSKDWLKICITSKARSKIKNFLTSEERKKSLEIGQKIMEKNCQKFEVSEQDLMNHNQWQDFLKSYGFNKMEDVYIHLGYGKLTFRQIYKYIHGFEVEKDKNISEKTASTTVPFISKPRTSSPVLIEGSDNVMVSLAKCCNPVSGDPIKSYISRKRGIVVHRSNCDVLSDIEFDRFIDVEWTSKVDNLFFVKIKVVCEDKPGTLLQFSEAFNSFKLNITDIQVQKSNDLKALVIVETHIKDLRQFEQLRDRINQIDRVLSVSRIE